MHPIVDQIKRETEERKSESERVRDKKPHTRHRPDLKHKDSETIDEHHNSLPVPRSWPLHHQVPGNGGREVYSLERGSVVGQVAK